MQNTYLGVTIHQNLKWLEYGKQIIYILIKPTEFTNFCDTTCIAVLN